MSESIGQFRKMDGADNRRLRLRMLMLYVADHNPAKRTDIFAYMFMRTGNHDRTIDDYLKSLIRYGYLREELDGPETLYHCTDKAGDWLKY